ncbi:NECA1 protein, partial [Polyodon spathula]|nr:NECA1 protein [Polyodon spathula]
MLLPKDDCSLCLPDDGKLSFDEFRAYFSDGVLGGDELQELFHTIDTHKTDNLDTDELCEYFSQHLGEYDNVLGALEDLNISILKAMGKTKKDYQEASHLEQFVTRFLLKETANQLQSLQSSLECAMETTAEQTRQERQVSQLYWSPDSVALLPWRSGAPSNKEGLGALTSTPPATTHRNSPPKGHNGTLGGEGGELADCGLRTLCMGGVKALPRLETFSHILIVQRQLSVLEEELEEFRLALRQYIVSATSQTGCLHIAVQKLSNESRFILYEFWEHSNVWKNHLQTNYSKTFLRGNVDFLETPELMTTMLVPGKYTLF